MSDNQSNARSNQSAMGTAGQIIIRFIVSAIVLA